MTSVPRLDRKVPMTDEKGLPTFLFQRWWHEFARRFETQIIPDIEEATSVSTAVARDTARILSYTLPTNILTAEDAGANVTITVTEHTRVYPLRGEVDIPNVPIETGTIAGLSYSTQYWVYYDDSSMTNRTPTYVATTSAVLAQVGTAQGRHYVGTITTPAAGGAATTGTGTITPSSGSVLV